MIESPIWDIRDCAQVLTEDMIAEQLQRISEKRRKFVFDMWNARLQRYYATAAVLDAIVDGKFFAFDWEALMANAIYTEM